jgi:hypothetical protein
MKKKPDNNQSRIRRIQRAMKTVPEYDWTTENEDAVTDLLADLQHLCAAKGWDFDNCVRVSRSHFEAERCK